MSTTAAEKSTDKSRDGNQHGNRPSGSTHALASQQGKTAISDAVVAKIVGMAARDVPGVYSMGSGMSATFGALKERIGAGSTLTQGVAVEVGERQAAADLDLIVDYGVSIPDLAAGVRRNVIQAVERMCGLEVTEVNVSVDDVRLPDEKGQDQQQAARVQ